jgi:transcription antitermination factor NusG
MLAITKETKENLEHYLGQADVTARPPDPVSEWVMIIVRPGMEQEARDSLRRRGVGAWWPNYQKEEGAKDRETGKRFKRLVRSGVLPGILLSPARLDARFWNACDNAPGVINIARKASTLPILLTDIDIVLIHTIETGLNKALVVKSGTHSYEMGETVRFVDDEYRRLPVGKVARCGRNGEITVEVNLFGRMSLVKVLSFQIEPVDVGRKNQTGSRSTDARGRPAKSPSRH